MVCIHDTRLLILVHKYNQLMKDFPLNELLSATDLDKVQESLVLIFGHLNRKLKLSPYPIRRALPLVEAISRDFNDQLLRILVSARLPYTPYETFDRLLNTTASIFRTWDDNIKEFTNVARDVTRKRAERFIPIKVVHAHAKLQERTRYLREWRKQHEQLAIMTGPSKGLGGVGKEVGGMDMEEEVKEAYEVIKRIEVLDVSTEGTEIWVAAENAYNERVSRVENQIIARLRDRLGTARNANEMFRVFSKFNALFVRPKVSLLGLLIWLMFRFVVLFKSTKLILSSLSRRISSSYTIRYGTRHFTLLMHSSKPNIDSLRPTTCPKCVTYHRLPEPSSGLVKLNDNS